MSRRLTPITRRDLVKGFRQFGWEGPKRGTKHDFMAKGRQKVRIPNVRPGDIGVDLLDTILKQAGISREEWLDTR